MHGAAVAGCARAGAPGRTRTTSSSRCGASRGHHGQAGTCANAAQAVAADSPHHPVRDYLNSLVWDGTERLDTWLVTYLGAKPEPGREKYLDRSDASR